MAININQLTSELRMMPDQALQRMAQMYKADPYIFPMVISEDMARKKMRDEAQARRMQSPKINVADQAIMSMGTPPQAAPGIAALQAPNMQNMADGGIAGYAEGGQIDTAQGGMFDFAQRSEPVVRMSGGGVARYAERGVVVDADEARYQAEQREMDEGKRGDYSAETKTYFRRLNLERQGAEQAQGEQLRAQELARGKAAYQTQGAPATGMAAAPPGASAFSIPAAAPRTAVGLTTGLDTEGVEDWTKRKTAAPSAPPAAPPRAPSAIPARAGVQPSVAGAKETAAQFLDRQAIEQQARELEMGETTAVDEARRRRQKMRDERGEAYTGYEAAIKKEEEGAKGELEQSKAFAILNAGLAMMAGTSPRALENIGKGAMVGTGQYADAIKDFKKSAKERQRAVADIEQARRAEARADDDAQEKFEERASERMSNARKFGIQALMDAGIKSADMARQIYTTQVEQQGAMERTRVQTAAHDPLALYRALDPTGKGNIAKGFEAAQTVKREPITESSLRQDWAKSPALQMNYPNVDEFIRMMMPKGQTAGTSVDTSGFKVLGVRNP